MPRNLADLLPQEEIDARCAVRERLSGPAMLVHPRGDQVREGVCRGDEGDRGVAVHAELVSESYVEYLEW